MDDQERQDKDPTSRHDGVNRTVVRCCLMLWREMEQAVLHQFKKAAAEQADAMLEHQVFERLDFQRDGLAVLCEQLSTLMPQHFEQYVLLPLVNRLIHVIELARTSAEQCDGTPHIPLARAKQRLDAVAAELTDLLAVYGVEVIEERVGTVFDPHLMEAISSPERPCGTVELVVERSLRIGFQLGERTLRPQLVGVRWR